MGRCDLEPSQIVDFANICQVELPVILDEICLIEAGRNTLQLLIIACNFTGIASGYDLKARPVGGPDKNEHFWRGSNTGFQRKLTAGRSEFWYLTLRAREFWRIQGSAETANSIGVTISSTELVTELVSPDGSAKCA